MLLAALLTIALAPIAPIESTTGARSVSGTCDRDGTLRISAALDGGESRTFVVDTGSSLSFVEAGIAASLRLPTVGSIASTTSSGGAPVVVAKISVGGTDVGPMHIVTGERARLRGLIGRTDAGIIGMDVIRTLGRVTVDYGACRVEIGGPPSDRRVVKMPLDWHEGRPVVIVPGVGRLLLDSGATTLTVFEGTSAAATFRFAPGPTSLVRIRRVSGDAVARLGIIPSLPIAGLELSNVPTIAVRGWYGNDPLAPQGLLPLALFRRVYFNSLDGYVTLTR
jgi:predicted aspartyl protease